MVIVDFHIREVKEIAEEQVALGGQRKETAVSFKIILGSGGTSLFLLRSL